MSPNDLIRAASAPCLLLREEDVSYVCAKIDAHPWAARAFRKLVDSARTRVATPFVIPDRGGQWPHWYACQSCGAKLVTESPTVHRCPACDLVNSGEPWDSVPLSKVHQALSEDVRNLAVCYALTEERPFAEKAAEILLAYADAYPRYEIRDHRMQTDTAWASKVSWGTLGEAVWLIPVCSGYDLVRHADVLSPAEHQTIREQLLRPAAKLILKHNIGIHNIQCWHNCAIGMAALMLRDPDLLSFTIEGEVGVREQIEQGVNADGLWHEGSWGYHFYGMKPLLSWAIALRNCGLDLFNSRLRSMFEAPLKAVRPDGGLPAFHDSGGPQLSDTASHYEIALSTFEDPKFAFPIADDERDNLNALLYGMSTLPDPSRLPTQTAQLPDSGFVFMRQGSSARQTYAAFDYGPHGGGHGHPDKLGFTLVARGALQAPDPGSVAYGTPIQQAWYKQTVSHNTVVVDGKSQQPTTGALHFLTQASGVDIVQADSGDIQDGVRMIRTMVVTQDAVVMVDRLRSERVHTYDWVYHNRGTMRPAFSCRKPKKPLGDSEGYDVIKDLRRAKPEGEWQVTWKQAGSGVRLTFWGSKRQTEVYTGVGPANVDSSGVGFGAEDVPLVIARRLSRRRTTFASALQMFGSRPVKDAFDQVSLKQADRGRAYRYRCGKTDLTLVVGFLTGTLACGDVSFRGAAALIDRGKANRVILCDGETVTCFGHEVQVEPAGSVEVASDESGLRITNLSDVVVVLSVDDRSTSLPAGRTWRLPAN